MSSKGWKPWWEKVGDLDSAAERTEFMRGIGGAKPDTAAKNILYAVIAGYVGGRIAQRKSDKK
jgi:hypothetical protein